MPEMTPETITQLKRTYRDGLLDDTLPFWFPRCLDAEYGGYLTMRDRDGTLLDDDKGVWQLCRTAWLLGELCTDPAIDVELSTRDDWLDWCHLGIEFIRRNCFDSRDDRMWFHVTRDGRPIRKRRYAFSESFAAIAFGEYAKASGNSLYKDLAAKCLLRFIDHNRQPNQPDTKFTDTRPMKSIGAPMIAIATAQQLRDSIKLEGADNIIDTAIDEIRSDFIKPDSKVVMESVASDGTIINHFDGRTLNPGHAIEAAWFIMSEGEHRHDDDLIRLGCSMLEWMWLRGWDRQFGGLLYFVDLNGGPVQEYWQDMKFWWPHCETIIATLLAWHLTGEEKFAEMHRQVHDWTYRHFPDPVHGEWFGYLRRDGAISSEIKGNLWKGPFHLPRMQLNCLRILNQY